MGDKVLVVSGNASYVSLASNFGEVVTNVKEFNNNPGDFKLVMFTGGADVCPSFYNHSSPKNFCSYNIGRDLAEEGIFVTALENDISMTGICRGSQFLNVMCGGWLMHHITGHSVNHKIETSTGHSFEATSTHHQMCIPNEDGFILGWSKYKHSKYYFGNKDEQIDYEGKEVESIYYPDKKVFAVQYHPEYMNPISDAYRWYKNGVIDLLTLSSIAFKNKYIGKTYLTAVA